MKPETEPLTRGQPGRSLASCRHEQHTKTSPLISAVNSPVFKHSPKPPPNPFPLHHLRTKQKTPQGCRLIRPNL